MKRIIAYTRNNQPHRFRQYKGAKERYSIDVSKLEAETGDTISSVTWLVDSGAATITGDTLASSEAYADILTNTEGKTLLKVSCTGTNGSYLVYVIIRVRDPKGMTKDY